MKIVLFFKTSRGGPHYVQPFNLRFGVYAIQKWPFSGTFSLINSHPWSFYMQICYTFASQFLESLLRPCIPNF
jgi:hypothetical protein